MVTLPSTEPTVESLTKPLTVLGLILVVGSLVVAGVAFSEGDIVTTLGMELLLVSGLLAVGIGLSEESV